MKSNQLVFRVHAVRRMFERGISDAAVRKIITEGETIEQYPDDTPYPSRLMLGFIGSRPLHVVVADNSDDEELIIITVYEPDPAKWDTAFKGRKEE